MIALCGCDSDIFGGRKRVDLDRQIWEAERLDRQMDRQMDHQIWEAEQKEQKERKVLELAERKAQIDILIPGPFTTS